MQQTTVVKGYKVTDKDMQCRGYQYELGKEFVHTGRISHCSSGFHFCIIAADCFEYYAFKKENRVFEVEGYGTVSTEGNKTVCSHIKFIRELSWEEVYKLVNTGSDNTGIKNSGNRNSGNRNSGDSNSGNRNSGDSNSGDSNSGYRNSGNWNSGDSNSGDSNSGYRNSGNWNSGYWNSGNWNSGYSNSGNRNSGYRNSGNRNSGNSNSGNRNSGNRNSGDSNSGNWNSGDSNSGNWNSGNRNSGDSNSGYRNSGAFCTDDNPVVWLFDKPTNIPVRDWENHPAVDIMNRLDPTIWVPAHAMSDEEKELHPKWETTEGYLKTITLKEAWCNLWPNLDDESKNIFLTLPNFDAKKFEQITGVKIKNDSKRAKAK